MAAILILFPLIMAGVVFALPSNRVRPWLVPLVSLGHLALVIVALGRPTLSSRGEWLVLDPLGKVLLGFTSFLFLICTSYAAAYVAGQRERSNRVFCAC